MTTPEPSFFPVTENWATDLFLRRIREQIFHDTPPAPGQPLLVLLGGQSAAGKTGAQNAITAAHPGEPLVIITGDDLRQYHPDYLRLVSEYPLLMPGETARASGIWIRLALDYALERRHSIVLEGTFRDSGMVTATAARFAGAGYRVEVTAVATPAVESRLSAEERYLHAPHQFAARWTPPDIHDTAVRNSADVVAALEAHEAVSQVTVHTRQDTIYRNTRNSDGGWEHEPRAADALRAEQYRAFTPAEATDWLARYETLFQIATTRPGYLQMATVNAYTHLQADAANTALTAATTPADARAFADAHQGRERFLDVRFPNRPGGRFSITRQIRRLTMKPDREPPSALPETPRPESPRREPPGLGR